MDERANNEILNLNVILKNILSVEGGG